MYHQEKAIVNLGHQNHTLLAHKRMELRDFQEPRSQFLILLFDATFATKPAPKALTGLGTEVLLDAPLVKVLVVSIHFAQSVAHELEKR